MVRPPHAGGLIEVPALRGESLSERPERDQRDAGGRSRPLVQETPSGALLDLTGTARQGFRTDQRLTPLPLSGRLSQYRGFRTGGAEMGAVLLYFHNLY